MRLEGVTAEIRPRGELEAVDLGLAMARRDFWRCWALWWMAMGAPVALLAWWLWDSPAWFLFLVWWLKPAGMRMVLYQLSRHLFGEMPSWCSLWRELPRAWVRRSGHRFLLGRLSPHLPVALAVEDLEGLRGSAFRKRAGQLLRRGGGMTRTIYMMSELAAVWFGLVLFLLVVLMMPEGSGLPLAQAFEEWGAAFPAEVPAVILRTVAGICVLAFSITDVWLMGAGFGLYVNARTWTEGWDVELAFRRMAARLAKAAGLVLLALVLWHPLAVRAEGDSQAATPEQTIRKVKEHPDFKVHTVKTRVPKQSDRASGCSAGPAADGVAAGGADIVIVLMAAAVLGLLGWLLWHFRHVFMRRAGDGGAEPAPKPVARVVMGMAVTPESLPPDLPQAVWALWSGGGRHEALGLLYRGTIAREIGRAHVEIQEADTEGDCLGRVEAAGTAAHPEYFHRLTRVWIGHAYAGVDPDDAVVDGLCRDWPFAERRAV